MPAEPEMRGAPSRRASSIRESGRNAAFSHNGVRFSKQRFADETNRRPAVRRFDRRAQPRAAGADHEHVVLVPLVFSHLEQPHVVPDAHRTKPDEHIGERHPEQTHPGPTHVATVEAADAIVGLLAHGRARQLVEIAAYQMAQ